MMNLMGPHWIPLNGQRATPRETQTHTNTGNSELEWYQPQNVIESNGLLTLEGRKETVQGAYGVTYNYTSGMITSAKSFSQSYYYMEMRAKLPKGQGIWLAFWTLPIDGSWPPEIDAMEMLGNNPTTIHMTYHWGSSSSPQQDGTAFTGPDYSTEFHTYAIDWEPNGITWYIDGIARKQYALVANIPTKPMYILANLALGGSWPGSPDSTTPFPADMQIDYIRAWNHATTTPTPSNTTQIKPVYDTSSTLSQTGGTTATWNHTVTTNNNRLLLVGISTGGNNQAVTPITYNGVNLTKINTVTPGNSIDSELWYLKNPATGTHAITVSIAGGPTNIWGGASSYYNVDQTNPIGASITNTVSGNNSSVTLPTTDSQLVAETLTTVTCTTASVGIDQTQEWMSTNTCNAGSYKPSISGSTNLTWWFTRSSPWSEIAVPINGITMAETMTPTMAANATLTPTPTPMATNLLQNSSFETTGANWLSPWVFKTTTEATASISHDNRNKEDGTYSVNIAITKSNSNYWYVQLLQGSLPMTSVFVFFIILTSFHHFSN